MNPTEITLNFTAMRARYDLDPSALCLLLEKYSEHGGKVRFERGEVLVSEGDLDRFWVHLPGANDEERRRLLTEVNNALPNIADRT